MSYIWFYYVAPTPTPSPSGSPPIYLIIIYALVGVMMLIGVIAFIHFLVVLTAWCKRWHTAWSLQRSPTDPESPSELEPLRPQSFQYVVNNAVSLPQDSVLSSSCESIPLTTFSGTRSIRNSMITTVMELSEEEDSDTCASPKSPKICGAKLMKPKHSGSKSSLNVAAPCLSTERAEDSTSPIPTPLVTSSIFRDTLEFVREKYADFTKSAPLAVSAQSDEELPVVDLLIGYPPNLPFLTPRNAKEKDIFLDLAFAQQQLQTVKLRAERNELRQQSLQAEYNWQTSQDVRDLAAMDECLEGIKLIAVKHYLTSKPNGTIIIVEAILV